MSSCDLCNKRFSTTQMLSYHKDNNICTRPVFVTCKLCSKPYKNMKWMEKHLLKCSLRFPPNPSQIPPNPSDKNTSILSTLKKNKCKNCEKCFTRTDNLNRHLLKSCDIKKNIINSNNNNSNNNLNNSNNTININNSIVLKGYGKENLSYLTNDMKKFFCNSASGSIEKYLEAIHFNPKHPENHNIRMQSHKRSEVKIYNEEKGWERTNLNEVSLIILFNTFDILSGFYDDCNGDMTEVRKKYFEKFTNSMYDEEPKFIKHMSGQVKEQIANFDPEILLQLHALKKMKYEQEKYEKKQNEIKQNELQSELQNELQNDKVNKLINEQIDEESINSDFTYDTQYI
jgi:hypothetical protein